VPLCEGAIVSPCSPISDIALQSIIDRASSELTSLFKYSVRMRKKTSGGSLRLPYLRTGASALRNIRGTVSSLKGKTYTCGVTPLYCRQARFPRTSLEKHFQTIFSQTPSKRQKEFQRYGTSAIKRFKKFLAERFSDDSYICQ
jgi:hypothetical protein